MQTYFDQFRPIVDDWDAFQTVIQRPLPTTIWTNPLKTHVADLVPNLQPLAWHPYAYRTSDGFSPGLHWAYLAGLYHVQEEVSLLPVILLDPQPGERVLDMCSAPGNKTAQIAAHMEDRGSVIANDRNAGRMYVTHDLLSRMGITNTAVTIQDGANYPRLAGQFDRVLVDAPCSCQGTCRKDPSVLTRRYSSLAGAQKALLRKAIRLCRVGGRIVYATCTFAPEENELVVDAMLEEFGDTIQLLPARVAGFVSDEGITEWNGRSLHPSLSNCMRVWPHQNDTGGFFVAIIEKRDEKGVKRETEVETLPSPISHLCYSDAEKAELLAPQISHFGFAENLFDDYDIVRWSKRQVYLLRRGLDLPVKPKIDSLGLPFMRVSSRYPKMTTAAVLRYGRFAMQNVIDLEPDQLSSFFTRQDCQLSQHQQQQCTGTGYVILRYKGHVVGTAVYRAHLGLIESLFPKNWSQPKVIV